MAQLDEYNGYLVYIVCIMDPGMNLIHAYVDPGTGNILGTQLASMMETMMMHGEMFTGGAMKMSTESGDYVQG